MQVTLAKIIGKMGEAGWGQVHDFTPEDEDLKRVRGRMIATVGIAVEQNGEQSGIVELGREMLSRVQELYFGQHEGETGVVLRRAVEELGNEFAGVDAGVVAICEGKIYVAAIGEMAVWGRVGEKYGWVVPLKRDNRTQVAGLVAAVGQEMVLTVGNYSFWEQISTERIRAAMASGAAEREGVVEDLLATVHAEGAKTGEVGTMVWLGVEEVPAPVTMPEVKQVISKPTGGWKFKMPAIHWPNLRQRSVYVVNSGKEEAGKRVFYTGVGFLIIMLVLVSAGRLKNRHVLEVRGGTETAIQQMADKFEEAKALAELNPVRSKQLLMEVQQQMEELEEVKPKSAKLEEIRSELGSVLGVATGIRQVSTEEVVNLSWLREGMKAERIARLEGKLYVLDEEGKRLAEVDIKKKSGEVKGGGGDMGEVKFVATYPGRIMGYARDKGIWEVKGEKLEGRVGQDGEWGEITDMEMFAGNIYLLDGGKGQIWRYGLVDSGVGGKKGWLDEEIQVNGAQSMAIDGQIWVLEKSRLRKFTQGSEEDFGIAGLDGEWGEKSKIYTDEEVDRLYILDAENGRIISIKKNGEYDRQLVAEDLKLASDIVVYDNTIYGVTGSKVWEIKL